MEGKKGNLKIASACGYRVFGSDHFKGNSTTVHALSQAEEPVDLLAHSKTCRTIDNAYYWPGDSRGHYYLQNFSHHGRILICGHALLATAYHLHRLTGQREIVLETQAFKHHCRKSGDRMQVELPVFARQAQEQPELEALLRQAGFPPNTILQCSSRVWIAVTRNPESLRKFNPREFPWYQLDFLSPGALILTVGLPSEGYAFRYFSPWFGKAEDSATGSAQCYLAPFWLHPDQETTARQWSPAGTALIHTALRDDRVWISGRTEVMNSGN